MATTKIVMFGKSNMRLAHATLSRKLSSSACINQSIKNVVVIGGGLMGSGIAQVSIVSFYWFTNCFCLFAFLR
jgi:hypothetical protein